MAHRALVAYERAGGYDLHRSRWGGVDLTLRRDLEDERSPEAVPNVDPAPIGRVHDRTAVYDRVDWLLDEAVYVVPAAASVEAYLAVALRVEPGVPGTATATGPGLLAAPQPDDAAGRRLRWRVEGVREVLGRLLDRHAFDAADAGDALAEAVRSWASAVISEPTARS